MKIKNYRLFLLGFVAISFVLLTGFKQFGANNASLIKKQAASNEIKKVKLNGKENTVKPKQKKNNNTNSILTAKNNAIKGANPPKPLDLSVPFKDSESAALTSGQNWAAQDKPSTLFVIEKKKKSRSVDLDGQMLMSLEQETDKKRSLDGAAIVINLKR